MIAEESDALVVLIESETTMVGLVSSNEVRSCGDLGIGTDAFDGAVAAYVRDEYDCLLDYPILESVRSEIASALPLDEEVQGEVRGLDVHSRVPRALVLTSEEIRAAVEPQIELLCRRLRDAVTGSGAGSTRLVVAGAGATLTGLPERLRRELY